MDDQEHHDDADGAPTGRAGRGRWWRPLLGLALGGLLLWFVVSTVGGVADAVDALGRMRPGWVAVAVLAGAVRMGCYVVQVRWIGRRLGPMSGREAAEVGLVVYGAGAVMPVSPAEGLGFAAMELRRGGHSVRSTGLILGLSEWFTQRAFYTVAALNVLIVVAAGRLPWETSWPFVVGAVVVLVVLVVTARLARRPEAAEATALLLGRLRWHRTPPPISERRHVGHDVFDDAVAAVGPPRWHLRLVAVSVTSVLADAATLWAACSGAGVHLDVTGVLLASAIGTVATWVPLLPAGLGLVEGAVPVVLHRLGAPLDDAFAATVVHRAAGTLLPALAGAAVVVVLRSRRGGR